MIYLYVFVFGHGRLVWLVQLALVYQPQIDGLRYLSFLEEEYFFLEENPLAAAWPLRRKLMLAGIDGRPLLTSGYDWRMSCAHWMAKRSANP